MQWYHWWNSIMLQEMHCSHVMPKYYMPFKCHMCQLVHMHMRQLCQYKCHTWTQCNQQCDQAHIYFTLLAYAPEQICLQHHTYMNHCITTVVYIETPQYRTYQYKEVQLLFTTLFSYIYQQQTARCPSNAKYMSHMPISSWQIWHIYVSICALYKLTTVDKVTMSTGIHTLIIIPYAPKQICLQHHKCMSLFHYNADCTKK